MPCLLRFFTVFTLSLAALTSTTHAQPTAGRDVLTATAHWSDSTARPGDQRILAIVVNIADRFHINPDVDQLSPEFAYLIPTTLEPDRSAPSSDRLKFGPVQFPKPHQFIVNFSGNPDPTNNQNLLAYEKQTVFYIPIMIDPMTPTGSIELSLALRYQACDDKICLPPKTINITTTLTITDAAPASTSDNPTAGNPALFADFNPPPTSPPTPTPPAQSPVHFDLFGLAFNINAHSTLGYVGLLLVAAIGGLMLNFTPCVLPIIPLKIISLSQAAGSRGRCLGLGIAMAIGVIGFWLVLGGAIAWISEFPAINELFRHAWFTIAIGLIIAIMAIGMCGLFAIRLPKFIYQFSPKQENASGSFLLGIMTAILSTPCTAPFMGAAAAWSITQPPTITLTTFAAIGLGMALPYLILAAFPRLVDRMPRTGPASELVKQIMGLLMLAAAAYFLGLGISALFVDELHPTPNPVYWYVVGAAIIAAGVWLFIRTVTLAKSRTQRAVWPAVGLAIIMTGVTLATSMTRKPPIEWVTYSQSALQQAFNDNHIIVLDFTADWCLNCKTLEHTVLYSDAVLEQLNRDDVIAMKIDITSTKNQAGYQKLADVGRVAIPLLIVYAPDGTPTLESDFYTADQIINAIHTARNTTHNATKKIMD